MMTASSRITTDAAIAAAKRQQVKFEAVAADLRKAGANWQTIWQAEQRAKAAILVQEAIQDIITSEGNQ